MMRESEIVSLLELEPLEQVVLDNVTNKFRVFCYYQKDENSPIKIKIINEKLQIVKKFKIENQAKLREFKVVSENLIFLVCNRVIAEEGEEGQKVRYLLDLGGLGYKELDGLNSRRIYGLPYVISGNRLVMLSSKFSSNKNNNLLTFAAEEE